MKNLLLPALLLICLPLLAQNPEKVWIKSGHSNIYGLLSRADSDAAKRPLAIVSHGFNGTHEYSKAYFEHLNALGYDCYVFDFPCGSVNSRSDDNTLNMSIIDEQQHLENVISYFKQQPDVDADRILLIGESQGGLVSALAAANPANGVDRLVLVYPALCIPDNWNERYAQISDIPEITDLWGVRLGRRFFTELRYLDVYDAISKYAGPVLIIHGDADPVVPVSYSVEAQKRYPDASLYIIPGAGHGFNPQEFQTEIDQIARFMSHD